MMLKLMLSTSGSHTPVLVSRCARESLVLSKRQGCFHAGRSFAYKDCNFCDSRVRACRNTIEGSARMQASLA